MCNVPRQCVGPELHAPPSTVHISSGQLRLATCSLAMRPVFCQSVTPTPKMVLAQALNVRGEKGAVQVGPKLLKGGFEPHPLLPRRQTGALRSCQTTLQQAGAGK